MTAAVPDVIVEAADLVAIAVQQRGGVVLREVFELQQHVRPAAFDRLNKLFDEGVVLLAGDARMAPAHVQRIVEALRVVGADVQHHRQRVGRADAAAGGVQRQLADGDAHAADARSPGRGYARRR